MLYYDWSKIYRHSKGNIKESWCIFYMITTGYSPTRPEQPGYKYRNINFSGKSFLTNPEALIAAHNDKNTRNIMIYVALAARRNLADFLAFNKTTLDIQHITVDTKLYINNPFLKVVKGNLYFKFENTLKESKNGIVI